MSHQGDRCFSMALSIGQRHPTINDKPEGGVTITTGCSAASVVALGPSHTEINDKSTDRGPVAPIDNDIPAHVKKMETHLLDRLNQLKARHSFVTDVRGKGLLAAMEFDSDISGQVLTNANEAGILLNGVRPNAVRFMPPLTVTPAEIDEAVGRLDDALGKI